MKLPNPREIKHQHYKRFMVCIVTLTAVCHFVSPGIAVCLSLVEGLAFALDPTVASVEAVKAAWNNSDE